MSICVVSRWLQCGLCFQTMSYVGVVYNQTDQGEFKATVRWRTHHRYLAKTQPGCQQSTVKRVDRVLVGNFKEVAAGDFT